MQGASARPLVFKRCDGKRSRWNDIRNPSEAATDPGASRSYAEAGATTHATAAPETGSNTWPKLVKKCFTSLAALGKLGDRRASSARLAANYPSKNQGGQRRTLQTR
jgi:hypothetical protein